VDENTLWVHILSRCYFEHLSILIENTTGGFLITIEGIGGNLNESGTYEMALPISITLFSISIPTSVDNSGSA
jgi:hypothetical protein